MRFRVSHPGTYGVEIIDASSGDEAIEKFRLRHGRIQTVHKYTVEAEEEKADQPAVVESLPQPIPPAKQEAPGPATDGPVVSSPPTVPPPARVKRPPGRPAKG